MGAYADPAAGTWAFHLTREALPARTPVRNFGGRRVIALRVSAIAEGGLRSTTHFEMPSAICPAHTLPMTHQRLAFEPVADVCSHGASQSRTIAQSIVGRTGLTLHLGTGSVHR